MARSGADWPALSREIARVAGPTLRERFEQEPARQQTFSLQAAGLHLDLSRTLLASASLPMLEAWVAASGLADRRAAMLRGDRINNTEDRAVLHTALRLPAGATLQVDGSDVGAFVHKTLDAMTQFAQRVRSGQWRGATGQPIRDIVNIGIGGSALGPELVCQALVDAIEPRMRGHFLSNVDPASWDRIRRELDPATTLVVVTSKTWRTAETLANAQTVRQWLLEGGIPEARLGAHLAAVSVNVPGARAFGVDEANIFPFGDWVGGRYSIWSAVGLPVMLLAGPQAFRAFLAGAHAMDRHFAQAPTLANAPVMLALVSAWHRLAMPGMTEVVVPYCDKLRRLPAYLQQLEMESNGKRVTRDGEPLAIPSAAVIWGEPGTDAQHSFFQALHQGTDRHCVEFILEVPAHADAHGRDRQLLANALAQSETLMLGAHAPSHREHPGNRPSILLLIDRFSPERLGALLALYEHKTEALGWLMGINSFDQWGVELGKTVAQKVEQALGSEAGAAAGVLHPSTDVLVDWVRQRLSARDGQP